ncbi:MAG: phage/plasmid primase, P4 family [Pseudomonadota bacterium]
MKNTILGLLADYRNQKPKEIFIPTDETLPEVNRIAEENDSVNEDESLANIFLESSEYVKDGLLLIRYFKGSIFKYNGKHYEEIPNHDFEAEVSAWLLNEQLEETVGKTIRNNLIADIQGKILLPFHRDLNTWIGDPMGHSDYLLSCDNGILDLKKLFDRNQESLIAHTPNFFSTSVLPFKFDEHAKCPTWDKVVEEILPDKSKLRLLQQWFGYSLTGDVSYHKFMILLGSGANGKSVVCTVLRTLLGKGNVSAVPLESFRSDRQFNLAELDGKKANIVEEISAKDCDRISVGLLKDIIAGGEVQVQRKFKDPFNMRSKAKLLFATNEMPNFGDISEGLWRRLFVILFDFQLLDEAKQDKRLTKAEFWQESGEVPGILSWAIAGLFDIWWHGFSETEESKKIKIELKNAVSFEADFVRSNLKESPGSQISRNELYRKYEEACRQELTEPVKAKEFCSQVSSVFPKVQMSKNAIKIGGQKTRSWIGIKLQTESSQKNELNPGADLLSLREITSVQENLK